MELSCESHVCLCHMLYYPYKSWPSINTGLDIAHVIFCIYEQEACYVVNILYIVTAY